MCTLCSLILISQWDDFNNGFNIIWSAAFFDIYVLKPTLSRQWLRSFFRLLLKSNGWKYSNFVYKKILFLLSFTSEPYRSPHYYFHKLFQWHFRCITSKIIFMARGIVPIFKGPCSFMNSRSRVQFHFNQVKLFIWIILLRIWIRGRK